jgi:uncharacterized protein (DUF488 family)
MSPEGAIYTLGTSTRSAEEFIELLRSHGVAVVIDVRRFPTSRFEHFSKNNLSRLLLESGIQYIPMGEELGGYRRGGYQAFTTRSKFREGIEKLTEIAGRSKAAIVCAERLPWRCHRRFISAELENQGWQVRHIIDRERDWLPIKYSATIQQQSLLLE